MCNPGEVEMRGEGSKTGKGEHKWDVFLSWLLLYEEHRWFHRGSHCMGFLCSLIMSPGPCRVAREARASVGPFRLVTRHRGSSLAAS